MSVQEIIVAFLVTASVVYTIYSIVKIFAHKEDDSACGCSSCDFKTKAEDLKNLSEKKSI